jgi:transmembrane sensor
MSGPEPGLGEAREPVRRIAADWVARRHAGLDAVLEAELAGWLAADPQHAAALREMEVAWALVNGSRLAGQAGLVRTRLAEQQARHSRRVRARILLGMGLAAATALALMVAPTASPPATPALVTTAVVRPDLQVLADGSRIELNAGAEVAVDFSPARRGVRLLRGEALFTVTKNPRRPFVVTAGTLAVRAVGTAFTVRLDPKEVGVLVTEGRVAVERVEPAAGVTMAVPAAPIFLSAGGKIALPTEPAAASGPIVPAVAAVTAADIIAALSWRGRRIEFTDTPLAEAVRLFNDRNRLRLKLATPALAQRRIGGIYWSDDPEGFARLLEAGLGLVAERADGEIVLHAAR